MTLRTTVLALTLVFAQGVFAHGNEKHPTSTMKPGRDSSAAQLTVDPAAADAVATVERFSTALAAGDLAAATAELDPAVLILESGGAEHSRDEYLGGHAKSDAEFLKGAHITLKRRTAQAAGDFAWVGSESEIHAMKGTDMLMISSSETMVVRKTALGWKIVHIHWSSRKATPPAAAASSHVHPKSTVNRSPGAPEWMSDADLAMLTSGAGAGLAGAAEAHGWPGPKHVLELADELELSPTQREAMQALEASMSAAALERGPDVLAAETALDAELSSADPDASRLQTLARVAGDARGRLRGVHLRTHLSAGPLLTAEQRTRYVALRSNS
jgi:ketosteroid isomerase-like protein/Spy/CpxP family protein refolding chaperone